MYRPIPGFDLYEINQDKEIRHRTTLNIKAPHRGSDKVRLYCNGNEYTRKIDKLFDLAFPELVLGVELPNLSRYKVRDDGSIYSKYEAKLLTPATTEKGYLQVSLILDDNTTTSYLVHRLVALAYLEVPDNYKELQINHIDGVKSNNKVDNLEWCTNSENNEHAWNTGLYNSKFTKCKLSFDGTNWIEFDSTNMAAEYLKCPVSTLRTCLLKNRNTVNPKFRCRGHIVLDSVEQNIKIKN
jgi:hypothetical protein